MSAADRNPSNSSYYVTDYFYAKLVADFEGWDLDARRIDDGPDYVRARSILLREARYLDQDRLRDWLALFSPECAYWIPGTRDRGDPRREIAFAFHDRRQLEDRVYRLETGYAWSQTPVSRTSRMITNIEVFGTDEPGVTMVRSNFQVTEYWNGQIRFWTGYSVHRLAPESDVEPGFGAILAKQVNLIDCDENHRNPSITL